MSDEIAEVTESEPVVGSTEVGDVGQVEDSIPSLNLDEYKDYRIPVKLDGEELQVPLAEAIAGYQRQADYTRKTQELAEQRQSLQFAATLQSALENDPAATIDLLSRHYGISRQAAQDMVDSFDEELDPQERRLRELDTRIAQFEEFQTQQQVEAEVKRLQSKYSDFDINEVVGAAVRMNSTDLEATYKQLAFDKIMHEKEIQALAAERQRQESEKITEAKRAAAVVSGGASASAATTDESTQPISSVMDAWLAAKRQLNANF